MVLSNAERQRLYSQRLKVKAHGARNAQQRSQRAISAACRY
jgi:hypothetical protein